MTSIADESEFSAAVYEHEKGKLNYRLFKPSHFKDGAALVLTLHGSSSKGSDNKAQLRKDRGPMELKAFIKKNKLNAVVLAPQCPSGTMWADTPWYGKSHTMKKEPTRVMTQTIALVKSQIKALKIDPSRVYVTGVSIGGFGCWDIIQREPKLFAAAIPVCGGADTAFAETLKNMPIWIFHGDNDTIVYTKRSRDMAAALKKAGSTQFKYTEYPNTGHDAFTPSYNNPNVLKWLFEQKK